MGPRALRPSSASAGSLAGAESEVDQPRLVLVLQWHDGTTDCSLTHCAARTTPATIFNCFQLFCHTFKDSRKMQKMKQQVKPRENKEYGLL